MENLNAEQVKKALECCAAAHSSYCRQCPVDVKKQEDGECGTFLAGQALALITSQEQRIGELEKRLRYLLQSKTIAEYDEVDINTKEYVKDIHSLDANFKHLTEENERVRASSIDYRNIPYIKAEVRADTVRKMQERLKAECNKYLLHSGITLMLHQHIDRIAKEMLEGVGDAGE